MARYYSITLLRHADFENIVTLGEIHFIRFNTVGVQKLSKGIPSPKNLELVVQVKYVRQAQLLW